MPSPLEKARQDPTSMKGKILATARRLFGEYGFHGVTTRMLAKEVGVDVSTLYYHWGEKQDLYEAVLTDLNEEIGGKLGEIEKMVRGKSIEVRLEVAIDVMCDHLFGNPEAANLMLFSYFSKTRMQSDLDTRMTEHLANIAVAMGLALDKTNVPPPGQCAGPGRVELGAQFYLRRKFFPAPAQSETCRLRGSGQGNTEVYPHPGLYRRTAIGRCTHQTKEEDMALNLDAVGQKLGPLTKDYTWKDVVLYALGVGAGFSDLRYCYEKDLKVIPSFSIASIFDILAQIGIQSNVNLAGVLHGEQELIFHSPIPPEGTMTTEGRISRIYDKGPGRGALIIGESDTFHSDGQKLFTSICTVFGRLDGGFGGDNAPRVRVTFPDREPDFTVEATPSADQPLLYRLSGDIFTLHVDPEFAKMSGFEKPIMHGLCTHGFACRTLVDSLIPGEPEKARRMVCRFTKPLYPGVPIRILIWKTGDGEAMWRVVNAQTEETVIDNGIFEYGEIPEHAVRFAGRVAIVTGGRRRSGQGLCPGAGQARCPGSGQRPGRCPGRLRCRLGGTGRPGGRCHPGHGRRGRGQPRQRGHRRRRPKHR